MVELCINRNNEKYTFLIISYSTTLFHIIHFICHSFNIFKAIGSASLLELREQGATNLERIQEVIVSKSNLMANVLSQGNSSYKKWLIHFFSV